jgi:DNA polymerase
VQATAHDLLRVALRQLPETIAHVHDEIVVECREEDAEAMSAKVHEVMCTPPEWAQGLPLAAEGAVTRRYS